MGRRSIASRPHPPVIRAVVVAGCIWGLFNAAIGMIFGFGTTMRVERGWSLAEVGSVMIVCVSSPMAGFLADRTGKHKDVMLGGFALFAIVLLTADRTEAVYRYLSRWASHPRSKLVRLSRKGNARYPSSAPGYWKLLRRWALILARQTSTKPPASCGGSVEAKEHSERLPRNRT